MKKIHKKTDKMKLAAYKSTFVLSTVNLYGDTLLIWKYAMYLSLHKQVVGRGTDKEES